MHRVFNRYFSLKVCVIDSSLWKMKIQQRNILLATLVPTIRSDAHAKEQLVSYAFQNIALSQQTSRRLNEFRSDSFQYWSFDVHFEDWLSIGYEIDWTARNSIAEWVARHASVSVVRSGRVQVARFEGKEDAGRPRLVRSCSSIERLRWRESSIRKQFGFNGTIRRFEFIESERSTKLFPRVEGIPPFLPLSLSPSPFLSLFLSFRRCLANEILSKKLTINTILKVYRVDSLFLNPRRGILSALLHPFLHDIPFLSFLFPAY